MYQSKVKIIQNVHYQNFFIPQPATLNFKVGVILLLLILLCISFSLNWLKLWFIAESKTVYSSEKSDYKKESYKKSNHALSKAKRFVLNATFKVFHYLVSHYFIIKDHSGFLMFLLGILLIQNDVKFRYGVLVNEFR